MKTMRVHSPIADPNDIYQSMILLMEDDADEVDDDEDADWLDDDDEDDAEYDDEDDDEDWEL